MLRKTLVLLLAALMLMSMALAGTAEEKQKLVFWDKSEYVAAYNTIMQEKVKEFSEMTGIEVEYVIIPSADQKNKLMASIEAGSPPDLFMSDDMVCAEYVGLGQLAVLTDVVETLDLTDAAKEIAKVSGENYLVPLCFLAPGCYWRHDLWTAAGLDKPTTWQDFYDDAKVVNDPKNGVYAVGFPMGASGGGDAESMMRALILSFGGIPVNAEGKVTINSKETLAALEFVASFYKEGLTSPDSITWDDGGNNAAYLAGTAGIIFNSGSVWSALKNEKPELLANTEIIAYPQGPAGSFVPGGANAFAVFANGQNPEAAKEFIKFFMSDTEDYNTIIEALGGMWQPSLNGLDDTDFWKDPLNAGWLANSKQVVRNFYPAPADDKANAAFANQLCVKAVQKIVVGGLDAQTALNELEAEFKAIYGEN